MNEVSEGWILYDGACGICSSWALRLQRTLSKRGFEIAPLQEPWVQERLQLDEADSLADLRLLLPDGRQLRGADAYRHVLRRFALTYPIYLLSRLPLASWVFDRGYRSFADHRHSLSKACRLPVKDPS